jgi:hypothetical protein
MVTFPWTAPEKVSTTCWLNGALKGGDWVPPVRSVYSGKVMETREIPSPSPPDCPAVDVEEPLDPPPPHPARDTVRTAAKIKVATTWTDDLFIVLIL